MFTSEARMQSETVTQADAIRVQALAQSLDCLTEQDLCALYGITPGTAEAWRKRRKGPAYILAGNNYLYPRRCVAADLKAREREPVNTPAKGML
jgi:hypothetical protein